MNDVNNTKDFVAMSSGMEGFKLVAGLVEMFIGVIAYVVNYYYFNEYLVELGAMGMFGFGLFLVGMKNQTVVSPTRKLIRITKGFFFLVFTRDYGSADMTKVYVELKTRSGTDPNGIGPTKEDTIIYTYCVILELKSGKIIPLTSSSEKSNMNIFAKKVSLAMGIPFTTV